MNAAAAVNQGGGARSDEAGDSRVEHAILDELANSGSLTPVASYGTTF